MIGETREAGETEVLSHNDPVLVAQLVTDSTMSSNNSPCNAVEIELTHYETMLKCFMLDKKINNAMLIDWIISCINCYFNQPTFVAFVVYVPFVKVCIPKYNMLFCDMHILYLVMLNFLRIYANKDNASFFISFVGAGCGCFITYSMIAMKNAINILPQLYVNDLLINTRQTHIHMTTGEISSSSTV